MAVLGKIRSLGPVALISVIGLALFAFVFSTGSGSITDVFKANEFNQSRVAEENDKFKMLLKGFQSHGLAYITLWE